MMGSLDGTKPAPRPAGKTTPKAPAAKTTPKATAKPTITVNGDNGGVVRTPVVTTTTTAKGHHGWDVDVEGSDGFSLGDAFLCGAFILACAFIIFGFWTVGKMFRH